MQKKIFLLDAMALIYRAYYAMVRSPRVTSKGLNTSAIFGFINTLHEVIQSQKPTHIAVSFDTGSPTLRHADFADYKAHREATPDDIVNSVPYIKQALAAFNIPVLEKEGYEADDIIGTLAKLAEIEGFEVYMMTSDKDYGQLVSEHIHIYKPGKFGQKAEIIGVAQVCEKYAIQQPEQLIDILGLWGDASDNIPGVPNVGEVKAKKLIAQFGSIEAMYQQIHLVENEKLRQSLIENQEKALMSKMLATIILDVPIDYKFDDMSYCKPNAVQLQSLFTELEFRTLGTRIFADLAIQAPATAKSAAAMPDLFSELAPENQFLTTTTFAKNSYKDFEHHERKLLPEEIELPIDQLFNPVFPVALELICDRDEIKGLAVANQELCVYALNTDAPNNTLLLINKILSKNYTIITYQCKLLYKFIRENNIKNAFGTLYDLQIAHYLIQPEHSHLLDRLCDQYLDYALLGEETLVEAHPPFRKACERVEIYLKLYPIVHKKLIESGAEKLFREIEMPLAETLANMEYDGVFIDKTVLQESSAILGKEVDALEKQIFDLAEERFNIASPKQLGEILFGKLRIIENAKLTKSKQYQTGEEVLAKLANKHPIVPLILEWRTLAKLKSTYLDALPQLINPQTGRVHTTYAQTVTSTGRLSSLNPNLQNIPIRTERGREIRKAFTTSNPNNVIMAADYSQIELRIVASVCGDEQMIASFRAGKDIHSAMAAQIYHVAEEQVTADMRRHAKTVNFGILYGMSAFGLADRLQISHQEARTLITRYFESFPRINQYLENTIALAQKQGFVETLFGRRRYIRDIESRNGILRKAAERNAINAPIQGTAADLIKVAMVAIFKEIVARNLKSKMLMQVHDELVFEVPAEEIEIMQLLIVEKMQNALSLAVPLDVDMKHGKSWFEAH